MSYTTEKAAIFDKLLLDYEREFAQFSVGLKRMLAELIQTGPLTKSEVIAFFSESGMMDVASSFVNRYDEVIDFTAMISKKTGIPLVLPERSLVLLELYKQNQVQNILGASESIMKTVTDASFRYGIGESKMSTIIKELDEIVNVAGRRIVSEAYTGASIYDRTVKYEQFTNAEVELYFYDGPLDKVTRDVCRTTLSNSKQFSGWTIEDIRGSGTPFAVCGGYGCRHEWLPFVEGLDDLIKGMQKDAGITQGINP